MTESWIYRVVLLPSAVFLSVVFGGSYGSGQEMVQFVTVAGPQGGYFSLLTLAVVWGLLLGFSFELARRFNTHEYSGFMAVLLSKGAVIYEFAIVLSMILVLAICASGAGTVIGEHFGIPIWLGSLGLLTLTVLLAYFGLEVVEKSMLASVIALLALLSMLCATALTVDSNTLDPSNGANPFLKGAQYGIVNGGFIPLLLFCGRLVRNRAEAFAAGAIAGLVATIPGFMLHTSLAVEFPAILDEPLPVYALIESLMSPWFLSLYAVILFVMITQTAVGMVQGMAERADKLSLARRGNVLSAAAHAGMAATMILLSMLLAEIGFVTLIAHGYDILLVVFVIVFVIPLFTYGAYRIFRGDS